MLDCMINIMLFIYLYLSVRFNQCYGVVGILDYLHGTDILFRESGAYKRHTLLLGLTPAKELYPDSSKGENHCETK